MNSENMEFNSISPKILQREGAYEQAIVGFARRYLASYEIGDEFIRPQYLDEIAQTICLQHRGKITRAQLDSEMRRALAYVIDFPIQPEMERAFDEDRELVLLKRYPSTDDATDELG